MICNTCRVEMKPLFSSFFCPNNCDKKNEERSEFSEVKFCRSCGPCFIDPDAGQRIAWQLSCRLHSIPEVGQVVHDNTAEFWKVIDKDVLMQGLQIVYFESETCSDCVIEVKFSREL